jgi:hypothetical protein
MYSIPSIHKRKDLWGDDADDFAPQRWLDGRVTPSTSDLCHFMPFNAGPRYVVRTSRLVGDTKFLYVRIHVRICLGMDFAYHEASFVLIRMLQVFERFTLAQAESAPLDCLPPAEWKGRKGRLPIEEFRPGQAVTVFAKVRISHRILLRV